MAVKAQRRDGWGLEIFSGPGPAGQYVARTTTLDGGQRTLRVCGQAASGEHLSHWRYDEREARYVCKHCFPTDDPLPAWKAPTKTRVTYGPCPTCGREVQSVKQVGRCVYAKPCDHRMFHGRVGALSEQRHEQVEEARNLIDAAQRFLWKGEE